MSKNTKTRVLQAKPFGNISFYDRCRPVALFMRTCKLYWTHNFFILDEDCPILTWRWCFFHRRQTVSHPQQSGSHFTYASRRCSIPQIPAIGHVVVDVWFIRSGEGLPSPLDWVRGSLSTNIWAGVKERGWVRSIEPTISIGRWPAGKSQTVGTWCKHHIVLPR